MGVNPAKPNSLAKNLNKSYNVVFVYPVREESLKIIMVGVNKNRAFLEMKQMKLL